MEIDLKYFPKILRCPQSIVGFVVKTKLRSFAFFFLTALFSSITSLKKKKIPILGFVWMWCPKYTTTALRNGTPLLAAGRVAMPVKDQRGPDFLKQTENHLCWRRLSKPCKGKLLTLKVPTQKNELL